MKNHYRGGKDSVKKMKQKIELLTKKLLEDHEPEERWKAAWALGKMEKEAKAAVPALIKVLQNEEVLRVRLITIETLEMMEEEAKEALPILLAILKNDTEGGMRWRAARSLGKIRDKTLVPHLTEALSQEENNTVRLELVWALGEIGGARAKTTLLEMQQEEDIEVQVEISNALEKLREGEGNL